MGVEEEKQILEALEVNADVIMLDNMNIEEIQKAVDLIDGRALIEVSGGIIRNDLAALKKTNVDFISVGALTHAARSVDMSMRIECENNYPSGM